MLLELVLAVKPLVAQTAVEGPFMHHAVLNEVRACCKALITQSTRVGSVPEMKVLVFHENMFVAEAALADIALVRLLADMRKPHMSDEAIFVAKLLLT